MIGGFPTDLFKYIASFLEPKDWVNVRLANRHVRDLLNENSFWQLVLLKNFPYLLPPWHIQFQNDPRSLFIALFEHVREFKYNLNFQGIVQESTLNYRDPRILEAGNGNITALNCLNIYEKGIALEFSAWCGNFPAFDKILNQPGAGRHIDIIHYEQALKNASLVGNSMIIDTILRNKTIKHSLKENVLLEAAQKGYQEVVEVLLRHESENFEIFNKGLALIEACKENHANVVETILDRVGNAISHDDKMKALKITCERGHLAVAEQLFSKLSEEINPADKARALWKSALAGHESIVEFILRNFGHEISRKEIKKAIWVAERSRRSGCVALLLDFYAPEMPLGFSILTFGIVNGLYQVMKGRDRQVSADEYSTLQNTDLLKISHPGDALTGLAFLPSLLKRKANELEIEEDVELSEEEPKKKKAKV